MLWEKKLPNGTPTPLTRQNLLNAPKQMNPVNIQDELSKGTYHFQSEPAFSPDGKSIAFVTWNDVEMGKVVLYDYSGEMLLKTGIDNKVLTKEKGIYRTPSFSPDGKMIVFRKDGGNEHQGFTYAKEPGIYVVPADGSAEPKLICPQG